MKIAFIGKMCSGKTWCINYLKSLNSDFFVTRFAKMVKVIANDLFFMTEKDRVLLQQIGTKMREINPDVFVYYVIQETLGKQFCLLDDARYHNEIINLKKNGWILVKLSISPELQLKRLKDVYPDTWETHLERTNHESETQQDSIDPDLIDYTIDVNRTDVKAMLKHIYINNLVE